MKQLHNNKWVLTVLMLIIIFSPIGNDLSVIAETLDSSEYDSSEEKEIEEYGNESHEEYFNTNGNDITNDEINNEVRASLPSSPPNVGDVGYLLFGQGRTDNEIKESIKYDILPTSMNEKFTISNTLGPNVGDTTELTINEKNRIHIWFYLVDNLPYVQGESWYGDLELSDLVIDSLDSSIKASVKKDNNGQFSVIVERIESNKNTSVNISFKYKYDLGRWYSKLTYNPSGWGEATWGNWQVASPETISSVKTAVEIPSEPLPDELTAEAKEQVVNLGETLNNNNVVTNVKLGNQSLSLDEYTVELDNTIATDTVGKKSRKSIGYLQKRH